MTHIMTKKLIRRLLVILVFILLTGLVFIKPAFNYLSGFLSKSEKVDANVLIVEGWLPENALYQAGEEFKKGKYEYIVTTGIKTTFSYFGLYSNGYLIFKTRKHLGGLSKNSDHVIDIDAYSELGGVNRAHFNFFINDSLISNFYADEKKRNYSVHWKGSLSNIDSVSVQFDNDSWGQFGDRNLFVKNITIDNQIVIPYMNNSIYAESDSKNKPIALTNFYSNAELARGKLISMGIDSTKIFASPGERVKINRTLTSALAFRNWLYKSGIKVSGINIFSMGTHARRTWMTYNKILNEKYNIGIISIPDYIHIHSREFKALKTIRETIGILYYWLILIPY